MWLTVRCILPVKLFKDKKKKYFSFLVQDENKLHRGVCFSPEKHRFFEKIANDNSNSGTEFKHFEFRDKNSHSIVNYFKLVKSTDFNFTHKSLELRHFIIQQAINECAIIIWHFKRKGSCI